MIMIYDIIKLQILSYYSTEFHKFFCAINCCSYKTHFRIFAKKSFWFIYFREKVWPVWTKLFEFFRETFRSLDTLNLFVPLSREVRRLK